MFDIAETMRERRELLRRWEPLGGLVAAADWRPEWDGTDGQLAHESIVDCYNEYAISTGYAPLELWIPPDLEAGLLARSQMISPGFKPAKFRQRVTHYLGMAISWSADELKVYSQHAAAAGKAASGT